MIDSPSVCIVGVKDYIVDNTVHVKGSLHFLIRVHIFPLGHLHSEANRVDQLPCSHLCDVVGRATQPRAYTANCIYISLLSQKSILPVKNVFFFVSAIIT